MKKLASRMFPNSVAHVPLVLCLRKDPGEGRRRRIKMSEVREKSRSGDIKPALKNRRDQIRNPSSECLLWGSVAFASLTTSLEPSTVVAWEVMCFRASSFFFNFSLFFFFSSIFFDFFDLFFEHSTTLRRSYSRKLLLLHTLHTDIERSVSECSEANIRTPSTQPT